MPIFSAADAISPAVYRTRQFLFAPPFRWSTFLKLCLVAAITEGVGTNLRSSLDKSHTATTTTTGHPGVIGNPFSHLSPEIITALVAGFIAVMVIGLLLAYLVTRLRFAYFHCLVHNTRELKPGWYLYRDQAFRFFLMNLAVGVGFLVVLALVAIPFAAGFWRVYQQVQAEGHPDWGLVISLILPLIPIAITIAVAALLVDIGLRDWMLPHYALENATAGQAWHAVWSRIRQEKMQFFFYAILRVIGPIAASIALFLLLIIPSLISLGAVGAAEWGIHSAFAGSSGASSVAGIMLEGFVGLLAFAFAVVVGISLGGPLSTGIREYALLFYAGRYQALASLMFAPVQTPSPSL
jgi:hypothetical protein